MIKLLDIQTIVNMETGYMESKDIAEQVFIATREQGISSVLFRNAIARKLGLNSTDSECLSLLSIRGVATAKELAHHTGLTTGSTTAMLDRLEKMGYIRRSPNPDDRRGILITISETYNKAAYPLVADIQKKNRELIERYSTKELAVIEDFLVGFTKNVVEQTQKIEERN